MEFGELKVITVDGKEMFPATACAKMLGYINPRKAILDHCKGGNELVLPSGGGIQKVKYITEGDLYRLIIRSKLPSAERFEQWVFDEVLPSMRKGELYGGMDLGQLVSLTVAEVMKQLQPKALPQKPKRTKNRVYGKIDFLPTEMKDEVIRMLFSEKCTYMKISSHLKEKGYDVSKSCIGRYASRLYKSIDELEMDCK